MLPLSMQDSQTNSYRLVKGLGIQLVLFTDFDQPINENGAHFLVDIRLNVADVRGGW